MRLMNAPKRNLALATAILTAGGASVMAQPTLPPPVAATSTNAGAPQIQFAAPLHEFGRVKSGEPVKYTYVFTNTGNALLIINSVQPQCGCTTAGEWTKQVEPGQTGSIPIQFNTLGYNGSVFKQVTVRCNVTNQPIVFLQLKGTVYKPFEVIPQMAVLNVPPDADTVSAVVIITNNTEEPLMLSSPQSNNRTFAAELKTNTPGKSYQLTISTVPPLAMGSAQAQIVLQTGLTNPPTLNVPAVMNVQPAIMVVPSYITLAPGPLAAPVTNSVSISNRGTNSVELSDPVVSVPGVEAQIRETQAGKAFLAFVAFPQGFQVPPGQQVALSFKTTHPRFPVVKVPIMQMPRPMPRAVAAPSPVKATPRPPVVRATPHPPVANATPRPPVPPRPKLPPPPLPAPSGH